MPEVQGQYHTTDMGSNIPSFLTPWMGGLDLTGRVFDLYSHVIEKTNI